MSYREFWGSGSWVSTATALAVLALIVGIFFGVVL